MEQAKKIAVVVFAIVMIVLGVAVVAAYGYTVNSRNYGYYAQPKGNIPAYGSYGSYGNPTNGNFGYNQGGNLGPNGYGPYGNSGYGSPVGSMGGMMG